MLVVAVVGKNVKERIISGFTATPLVTDPDAEDRLWAAVLRDHPG